MVLTVKQYAESFYAVWKDHYDDAVSRKDVNKISELEAVWKDSSKFDDYAHNFRIASELDAPMYEDFLDTFHRKYQLFEDLSTNPQAVINIPIDGTDLRFKAWMDSSGNNLILYLLSDSYPSHKEFERWTQPASNITDLAELYLHYHTMIYRMIWNYIKTYLLNQSSGQQMDANKPNNPTEAPMVNPSPNIQSQPEKKKPVDPMQRYIDQQKKEHEITEEWFRNYQRRYRAELLGKIIKLANRLDELGLSDYANLLDSLVK